MKFSEMVRCLAIWVLQGQPVARTGKLREWQTQQVSI